MIRRVTNRWRRFAIEHFARRDFRLPADVPYVSFTFDDFPRTALTEGGRILRDHGARGTYFVSLHLLDADTPSGRVASLLDLKQLLEDGHELGCHTFDHLDGSVVTAAEFERSIEANDTALTANGLHARFQTFAYPLNGPTVSTKKVAGARFTACRWGGQSFNRGLIDSTLLNAYFLDSRTRGRMSEIATLIERNAAEKGWLIFGTHDVDPAPSEYGCSSNEFARIVQLAAHSGARVLPMNQVCAEIRMPAPQATRAHMRTLANAL
jgi:peptidoglycan/xylan/chitin deacetylase (PgdA/CDA1 family)